MAEARASKTIQINRPVEEVFAFMVNYNNNLQWQENLVSVVQADVPPQVGSRITTTRNMMGGERTTEIEVKRFEPNRCILTGSIGEGKVSYEGGFDFESVGESATRIDYHGLITTSRLMGPIGKMMARGFQTQMDTNLERLKVLLEGRP